MRRDNAVARPIGGASMTEGEPRPNVARRSSLAAAVLGSLAFAPVAFGSYSPSLSITRHVDSLSGDSVADIGFSQPLGNQPTARVQILSPFPIEAGLILSPGNRIGTFEGSAAIEDRVAALAGTLTSDDWTSPAMREAAGKCTGTDRHSSVWRLDLTEDGTPLSDPIWIFVDALPLTPPGPFSDFAATSLQLCIPFDIDLATATLHLGPVFQRFPRYTFFRFESFWTAINTPYRSQTNPAVDEAGAVQTQSLDRWLVGTTFSAERVTRTRRVRHKRFTDLYYSYFVRIRGSASAGCCSDTRAAIFSGDEETTPVSLSNDSFTTLQPLAKTTSYRAVFSRQPVVLEAPWTCVPPLPGMRCGTITSSGYTATSWEVRVVRPKLRHKRIRNGPTG
jgi:hypothetical protein